MKRNENTEKISVNSSKCILVKRFISLALSAIMLLGVVGVMPEVIVDAAYSYTDAVAYAKKYWSSYNSNYTNYNSLGGDCANFVSQCLYAGGVPQDSSWKPYTSAWVSCSAQLNYFKSKGYTVKDYASASDIKPGNPIYYYDDSSISHVAICVGYSSDGTPLVAAHNTNHWGHEWTLGGADYWGGSTRRVTVFINNSTSSEPITVNEKYRVNVSEDSVLYVRSTYSTAGEIVNKLTNGTEVTITKKVDNWGYSESLGGWLCLDYCVEIVPEPTPVNEKYRVNISEDSVLYVRSTYSTAGEIVDRLSNGTEVIISKKLDNWGYSESLDGWLCLDYCVQITLDDDTTPPVISDVEIVDVIPEGYTVKFKVTDESDIEEVKYWVTAKDSSGNVVDNMIIKDATNNGGEAYSFSVNKSDFNNEYLVFKTSIIAKDIYGNSSSVSEANGIPDVILPEYGDINMDGTINTSDAEAFEKFLLSNQTFTNDQFMVADINKDSKINVFDLIILKRMIINTK